MSELKSPLIFEMSIATSDYACGWDRQARISMDRGTANTIFRSGPTQLLTY